MLVCVCGSEGLHTYVDIRFKFSFKPCLPFGECTKKGICTKADTHARRMYVASCTALCKMRMYVCVCTYVTWSWLFCIFLCILPALVSKLCIPAEEYASVCGSGSESKGLQCVSLWISFHFKFRLCASVCGCVCGGRPRKIRRVMPVRCKNTYRSLNFGLPTEISLFTRNTSWVCRKGRGSLYSMRARRKTKKKDPDLVRCPFLKPVA